MTDFYAARDIRGTDLEDWSQWVPGPPAFEVIVDWPAYLRFRPQLAEAMDPAFYPIEYLDGLIRSGQARLWTSEHAAIVAEIKDYPGGARVVHGLVAAGRMEEIVALIPLAEQWGKAEGCTMAIVESRSGWMKALRPYGYETHQVAVRKEL